LKKTAISIALSLAAAALAFTLGSIAFIHTIELKTFDWRMQRTARPSAPADDIVLVSINDDSVRRLAPVIGRWPWPRLIHGFLIDYLTRAPAKLIVYDVLFTEPDIRRFTVGQDEWTGQESDDEFAKSIARAGNVILAADAAAEALVDRSRAIVSDSPLKQYSSELVRCAEDRTTAVPPIASLARAARGVGHTLLLRDDDGPLRHEVPFARVNEVVVPALPFTAAIELGLHDEVTAAQTHGCPPLIAYRGPTVGDNNQLTFADYSFYDLYYSEEQILAGEKPKVDPVTFKDKIVIVGATASGTYEVQTSPFEQGIAGAEIHANVLDSIMRRRSIAPVQAVSAAGLAVASALVVGLAGAAIPVWPLAAVSLALALALVYTSMRLFAAGTWMPLVTPLLSVALAFVAQLAWQYFVEGREKRQVKRLFSRYVPKDVYEQLLADPSRAALGGKRRVMTVLFSDVRGFTAMSEKATPEEVVGQLNEYFSRMVDVLFAHHGTLDKFVGDMVMGLFGAPLDDPDHPDHAVQAAIAMSHALDALNREWIAAGKPALDIGVGISTGEMVAGNIGSTAIMSYTVIGDTVNLGARLESLNKDYGTRIIISEGTHAALKGRYDIHPLGDVTVKGKSKPVQIFEVRPV
jgi:adenylate cyclase